MSSFLLKDTQSKEKFEKWLIESIVEYAREADLKWGDEDTLCEHFYKAIGGQLTTPTGQLKIASYKTRGRGPAAPEKKLGADGICLVNINTQHASLKGFFLFQAKKTRKLTLSLRDSSTECTTMLLHTAACYLLVLMPREVKMAGAMAVQSCRKKDPALNRIPFVSFLRFAVEQLLHGLMLEPFSKAIDLFTGDLRDEIKHVLTVVGSAPDAMAEAQRITEAELSQLRFELSRNDG